MHPRCHELYEYLATARQDLLTTVADLTAAQLQHRPTAEAWSPAETLEHLRLTEAAVVHILQGLLGAADLGELGRESDTSSVMGGLDPYRLVQVIRPVRAPSFVRPGPAADGPSALAGLQQTRAALLQVLAAADGWAVGSLHHPHPMLGTLSFHQWMLFVGQHEVRHTRQIARAVAGGDGLAPTAVR